MKVLETEPSPEGILVVETDLNVDFAPPVGYVEPQYNKNNNNSDNNKNNRQSARLGVDKSIASSIKSGGVDYFLKEGQEKEIFRGEGHSLRNAPPKSGTTTAPLPQSTLIDSVLDGGRPKPLRLPKNVMFFGFSKAVNNEPSSADAGSRDSNPFKGPGTPLRK